MSIPRILRGDNPRDFHEERDDTIAYLAQEKIRSILQNFFPGDGYTLYCEPDISYSVVDYQREPSIIYDC
ncbi:hypothetical protein BGAL_0107g00090 [Botrytis galanthina]|uniref:Uncharacterized protein n=1 Tax=Botrytis galanthina TaxID=278940 RepID=A0A4S8R185_9HELO|nr:hypothetical protein BGAL_0107g00090 [Botrytis galanthina]